MNMNKTIYILVEKNWVFFTQELECTVKKWEELDLIAKCKCNWKYYWTFGRKDFCNILAEYYNWNITVSEMNNLFDKIKK